MASSKYRTSVLAFKLNPHIMDSSLIKHTDPYTVVIDKSEAKLDIEARGASMMDLKNLVDIMSETESSPDIIRFHDYADHTCRETLLGEIFSSLDALNYNKIFKSYNYIKQDYEYVNYTVFIEYAMENGYYISDDRIDIIMEFYRRFLTSRSGSPFYVQSYEDRSIVLSYKNAGISRTYMASLLLWIFRNRQIMQKCLKDNIVKEGKIVTFSSLLNYLSHEFLKNCSWGDGFNPPASLSLFCYGIKPDLNDAHMNHTYFNGPAQFSMKGFSVRTMLNWVRDVFYVEYPQIIPTESFMGNTGTEFSVFVENIHGMLCSLDNKTKQVKELTNKVSNLNRKLETAMDSDIKITESTKKPARKVSKKSQERLDQNTNSALFKDFLEGDL